ncbi:ABC transporter permease [Thermodesulfobacteriota bacterium]
MDNLEQFNHYRQFVFLKVAANLRSEALQNYLSYLWWFIEPLLHMMTYYLVFSLLLSRALENFVAFLLTGLIPYLWFSRSITHGMNSITLGRGLMMQVHLPKILLPTISVLFVAAKQCIVFSILLIFLILYGIHPGPTWIAFPLLILTELLFIFACCFMVSAAVPFLPDLKFLVTAGIQMLLFCSGVFYNIDMIAPQYKKLFFCLNPMANFLHNYRQVLMYNSWPDWHALAIIASGSLTVILIMMYVFRRLDHVYPRVVL